MVWAKAREPRIAATSGARTEPAVNYLIIEEFLESSDALRITPRSLLRWCAQLEN